MTSNPISKPNFSNFKELGCHCDICPLNSTRKRDGFGYLPLSISKSHTIEKDKIRLIVVSEPIGRSEEKEKSPLSGRGLTLILKLLEAGNIYSDEVYITSSTLCRPDTDKDADLASLCCSPRLLREIKSFSKSIPILTLGKQSTVSLLGIKNIMITRGFIFRVKCVTQKVIDSLSKRLIKKPDIKGNLKYDILNSRRSIRGRVVFPSLALSFILRADVFSPLCKIDIARISKYISKKIELANLDDKTTYSTTGV